MSVRTLGLLWLLALPAVCAAQTITATATLEDGEAAVGASVQLLEAAEETMLDFAFLDETGTGTFRDVAPADYKLRIKFFGYQDTVIQFTLPAGEDLGFRIDLKPVAYDLPGVTVMDKIIGLRRNGDTLSYNLKAYNSGTEQTLGDILSDLPGMEVDAQGNVKVNNKKVDALLIDGNDIVNDQHKLALEGMQSDLVEGVELIQNYRTDKELFEENLATDKYAVNVLLSDEARGSWSGNAKVLGGTRGSISSEANVFRTAESHGWSLFLRQNNVGEKPIERPASLLLEELSKLNDTPINRAGRRSLVDQASGPDLAGGVVANNDYHLALSGDTKNTTGLRNKLYLTATLANRRSEFAYRRNYTTVDLQETLTSRQQIELPFLYLRNKLSIKRDKHFTELTLPVQYYGERRGADQRGTFGPDTFVQDQNSRLAHLSLLPQLTHTRKLGKALLLTLSQQIDYQQLADDHRITDDAPFLAFTEGSNATYAFEQTTAFRSLAATSTLNLTKRWGYDRLQYEASANYGRDETDNVSSDFFGAARRKLGSRILQHGVKYVKELADRKVRLIGSLNQVAVEQSYEATLVRQHYLLPYAMFYLEYFKGHAFSVAHEQGVEVPGLYYLNDYPYVQDARTLYIHNLDPTAIARTRGYTLSLFKKPALGGHLYNVSLSYASVDQAFITTAELADRFVRNTWTVVPRTDRLSVNAFTALQFSKWRLNATASVRRENSFARREEALIDLDRTILNYRLAASSVRWKNCELSSYLQGIGSQQHVEAFRSRFATTSFGSTVDYTRGDWTLRIDVRQQFQRSDLGNNQLTLADLDLIYTTQTNWKFYLEVNNLFNLNSTTQIDVVQNPNYEQVTTLRTFPGQLMVGVGYFF